MFPARPAGARLSRARARPDTFFVDCIDSALMIRAHAFFEGRVQGVFFRANTLGFAQELGLSGWVRNTQDGRVEAVFEGDDDLVRRVIEWCETRQPFAKVASKTVELSEPTGEFDGFRIR